MEIDETIVIDRAKLAAHSLGETWDSRLERTLQFVYRNPVTVPNVRGGKVKGGTELGSLSLSELDTYLTAYARAYYIGRTTNVESVPMPKTIADPAVDDVLLAFTAIEKHQLESMSGYHRRAMQAENVVGTLLEQYIASVFEDRGWIWCCGGTARSVDFIKDAAGKERLLQVKNRSNSENSSSSRVRIGTPIEKWHRVDAYTGTTFWEKLPDNDDEALSEDGFRQFIAECGANAKENLSAAEPE